MKLEKDILQSQVNVLDSFVGILQTILDKDEINYELYNDMIHKMDRAIKCYIDLNTLEV